MNVLHPIEIKQPFDPRYKLVPFNELAVQPSASYLVKGIIPRSALVVVWGAPKTGKSFWVFDLMMHVALGREYRGHKVIGGPVVYCALEGGTGHNNRAAAFRLRKLNGGPEKVPMYLVRQRTKLAEDHPDLTHAIRVRLGPERPVVVVLDTLNRSIAGSESSDSDMAAYIQAADAIREAFDCAVIIVHHCGIDATRPRGHTSLGGAADAQLSVKRDGNKVIVEVQWMKDGPEGEVLVSTLEPVEVGIDADGDPITSLVVEPADAAVLDRAAGGIQLSDAGAIALRAIHQAISERGILVFSSDHLPEGERVTTVEVWKEYCYKLGISSAGTGDAKRMAFNRAKKALIAEGVVGIWEEHVWPLANLPC